MPSLTPSADMESQRIMDRLICGDVGYGKTEIAIRAAFKAVQEGKQVVYLVPDNDSGTAALQHLCAENEGFSGATWTLMCRFRTPAEMKKTVEGSEKGYGGYYDRYTQSLVKGCEV